MKSEILGLLLNTLTANYEYSGSNRDNLALPIQIQLSKKNINFSLHFLRVLESTLYFKCSEKKMSLIR